MKLYIQLLFSGITGGLIVLGGYNMVSSRTTTENQIGTGKVQAVNFNMSPNQSPVANMPGDFVESAKRSTPSVVHIYAEESDALAQKNRKPTRRNDPFSEFFGIDDFFGGGNFYAPKNGSGSGVIYSSDGYIITNNHVVGFADKITVTDSEGNKFNATKVGTDATTDLALLKVDGGKTFIPVKVGDSEKVNVGEWVLAVGNPFGYLTSTVTAGIVSAKGRSLDIIQNEKAIEDFIQTDAAINPGNSGGALVNLQGELIGINTAIATPNGTFAGYSFAIPSNIVKKVVKDILENGGDIERTNLGVGGYDVNDELVKEFNLDLKNKSGFYVEEVEKRSAAQMGGLLPGDVIIGINSIPIRNYDDIEKNMKYNKVGDKVNIRINRNGKEITIPIQLRKKF
ncbi:MAG: trypsin-like peptidase domain-containing protein [Saprospiraceae bacterium]|nr:trypsin-like peptidase domain-containing protein [Saprospiraceae bacterium]MBK8668224.1 trypsin-like peptidase domain-containing protein [Saprospiraceae bacterium]MBL0099300.1 trypsin-like peptidase domain-containing protein [Saprospiraceae bacterium]